MASRAWPHEPTTSTFALVTALRSLTAVVIVADMAQRSVTCTEPQTTRRPFAADTIDAMTTNVAPSRPAAVAPLRRLPAGREPGHRDFLPLGPLLRGGGSQQRHDDGVALRSLLDRTRAAWLPCGNHERAGQPARPGVGDLPRQPERQPAAARGARRAVSTNQGGQRALCARHWHSVSCC
jgi:hypothetical protein